MLSREKAIALAYGASPYGSNDGDFDDRATVKIGSFIPRAVAGTPTRKRIHFL